MSRIGRFAKDEGDTKRYVVNYECWLGCEEYLTAVTAHGSVPLDDFHIEWVVLADDGDRNKIMYYVSGGMAEEEYDVTITITTSMSQIKEDWITHVIT